MPAASLAGPEIRFPSESRVSPHGDRQRHVGGRVSSITSVSFTPHGPVMGTNSLPLSSRPTKETPLHRTTSVACTRTAGAWSRTTAKPSGCSASRLTKRTPRRNTTSASCTPTGSACQETTSPHTSWLNLAAAQGHENARQRRDAAAREMSAEQLIEAQQAARATRSIPPEG